MFPQKFHNTPLNLFQGNVEWIRSFDTGSRLDIIARINGRLVGVQFFIDHEYAKYGHRTVERYGEHVNCKPMERGYLLELVPKNRLTKEELEEYETLRQNTVNIAERRLQIEKEKRHKKYLELKKEFE